MLTKLRHSSITGIAASITFEVYDTTSPYGQLPATGAVSEVGTTGLYIADFPSNEVSGLYVVIVKEYAVKVSANIIYYNATTGIIYEPSNIAYVNSEAVTLSTFSTDVSDMETDISAIKLVTDKLDDMIIVDSNGYQFTEAALNNTTGHGFGVTETIYTVTVDDDFLPNCLVWVTSVNDITAKVIASGVTDDAGQITFYLNSGVTYYFWRKIAGYSFVNPDEKTIE